MGLRIKQNIAAMNAYRNLSVTDGQMAKSLEQLSQDGISVVQTAGGAMNQVHSILARMRDLAVQASSSGSQDTNARTAALTELTQLNAELNRIGVTALDTAIQMVSTNWANLGAVQNRLDHAISILSVAAENLSASESRIRS